MANTYWVSRRIQHLEGVNWIRNDKKLSSLQYSTPNFVTATYLFLCTVIKFNTGYQHSYCC